MYSVGNLFMCVYMCVCTSVWVTVVALFSAATCWLFGWLCGCFKKAPSHHILCVSVCSFYSLLLLLSILLNVRIGKAKHSAFIVGMTDCLSVYRSLIVAYLDSGSCSCFRFLPDNSFLAPQNPSPGHLVGAIRWWFCCCCFSSSPPLPPYTQFFELSSESPCFVCYSEDVDGFLLYGRWSFWIWQTTVPNIALVDMYCTKYDRYGHHCNRDCFLWMCTLLNIYSRVEGSSGHPQNWRCIFWTFAVFKLIPFDVYYVVEGLFSHLWLHFVHLRICRCLLWASTV